MKFNLQWLAYPCWGFAIIQILMAIYYMVTGYGQPDIGPLIGFVAAGFKTIYALVASVLGWLIWRAFRE